MARIDTTQHWIAANTRQVWAALIDPAARTAWQAPEDSTATITDWDFTLGGGYRIELDHGAAAAGKTTPTTDVVDATFTRLAAGSYLEETVRFLTGDRALAEPWRLQWQLHPAGQGTVVEVAAFDVPEAIDAHDHVAALAAALSQLADAVEHRAAA